MVIRSRNRCRIDFGGLKGFGAGTLGKLEAIRVAFEGSELDICVTLLVPAELLPVESGTSSLAVQVAELRSVVSIQSAIALNLSSLESLCSILYQTEL